MFRAIRKYAIRRACDILTRNSMFYEDGVWNIERVGSAFPALYVKHIACYKIYYKGYLVFNYSEGRFHDGPWVEELFDCARDEKRQRKSELNAAHKAKNVVYEDADLLSIENDKVDETLFPDLLAAVEKESNQEK